MRATTFRPGHVGLNVTDLDRAVDFYTAVFGFTVTTEGKDDGHRFAFLADADALRLTLWEQSVSTFPTDRPGLHHLSFQVESVEQVRAAERVLRARNAEFAHDGVVAHTEGAESGGIFFSDPDGIRLEIYAPSGVTAAAPAGAAPTCGFF